MSKRKHDAAIDLEKLPLLSTRRVCILADCSPSTVGRSPLEPVGVRGRTKMYRTSEVMAWIAGAPGPEATAAKPHEAPRSAPTSNTDALNRLAALKGGAK